MAVRNTKPKMAYGPGDDLVQIPAAPIIAKRAPTTSDFAQLGTTWVDKSADTVYVLTSISSNSANWATSPASGVATFTSVEVDGGDIDCINGSGITIDSGNLTVSAGNVSVVGNLAVTGDLDLTGDFDITSSDAVSITSSKDAVQAVYLHADGGTSETIEIYADQGTAVNSVNIHSDVGGITLTATGLATADAINLSALAGGVDIDGILQVNIASAQDASDAVKIVSSAGGMDITAIGEAAQDIDISNTGGSVNISASEAIADAVVVTASAGGIDIAAVGGAGLDVDISNTGGSVNISATEAIADAVVISTTAGGIDVVAVGSAGLDVDISNTGGSVNISATEAVGDAIVIDASDAAGGIDIKAGTGGISVGDEVDTTTISVGDVAPTASRTITIGGGQVATAAVTDTIDIGVDGATANADSIKIVNVGTGALATGLNTVNIASGNVASGTHAVNVSTGTGTKIVNLGNADAITTLNVDAITLINDSVNADTSINTGSSTGVVAVGNAAAGAVTVDTAANIALNSATASNFTVTGASADLTLLSTGGSVNVSATEAVGDAIVLDASDAAGGIDLKAGTGGIDIAAAGIVTMTPATATAAAAAVTIDANVGVATLTGLTTASAASQIFTITDSIVTVGSALLVSISNLGANDAQMTVTRVTPGAGSFTVTATNNGAAALNGDVIITYWVIAA